MNANDPLEAADPSRISLNLRCGAFALALAVSSVALFLPADNADAKGGSSGSVATSASVTGSVVSGAVTVNNAGSQTVNVTAVSSSLEVRFPSGTTPPLLPACTQTDSCQSGFCRGSNPVTCTADHQCELATCDPTTGTCSGQAKADGTECIDGNVCTVGDHCFAGACTSGAARDCDDHLSCTDDGCEEATGCGHSATPICDACDATECIACGDAVRRELLEWIPELPRRVQDDLLRLVLPGKIGRVLASCPATATCRSGCEAGNGCAVGCIESQ